MRGHDHGVDAELHEPRDELGEGRDRGPPGKGKLGLRDLSAIVCMRIQWWRRRQIHS